MTDEMHSEILQFFNKDSGLFLGSIGSIGQGAKELIMPANMSKSDCVGIFSIYDYGRGNMLVSDLTAIGGLSDDSWRNIGIPDYKIKPKELTLVGENRFVSLQGHPRFTIADYNEAKVTYDQFPELLKNLNYEEDVIRMFLLSQTLWAVSPDGQKMVQATTIGSIIQFFKLKESSIELVSEHCYHVPIFESLNGQIGTLPETIYGFIGLFATDKNVYATMHGISDPKVFPNYIYKYDWSGKLINRYDTGRQICSFCVDDQSKKIYAVSIGENGEQQLLKFDLP
ncbi:MAG: TolB-like 6-bladed beta-propeller domain-containing protein [Clostridiales bacterium]|nr:TolB-like 6-bladed beta-propeller domain-containing protein [Clostridiales bacterium]